MTLQLARLFERINRNFDDRRLTGAFFMDVAKAFDTIWVNGILYKLTVPNFSSYLVKTISYYVYCRTFEMSFQSATSTCRGIRAGVAQGGLISPVLFSLYLNDIPTRSRHVDLVQYADVTPLVAMSRSPSLLVVYLESYLGRLERCHRDWRIAINVSKSTAELFVKTARRI
jgi:retron-type reverse transcriptase